MFYCRASAPERAGEFLHPMPVFGPFLATSILGRQIAATQMARALVIFIGIAFVMRRPVNDL